MIYILGEYEFFFGISGPLVWLSRLSEENEKKENFRDILWASSVVCFLFVFA